MAKQIKALVAITIGVGAEAVTHPAGWVGPVDDAVADDLVLNMDPPAAQFDNSAVPSVAPTRRSRSSRSTSTPADPPAGGEGGGDGAAGGSGGESDGTGAGGAGGGESGGEG